jgi:predicted metal-dependent phosphoesterase TrpH
MIDLHTHSLASDGTLPPREVVRRAHALGLTGLALTDHETTAGLAEAAAEAARLGIAFVPGIEINTDAAEGEFHFLGYFVQPGAPGFQATLARCVEHRRFRARAILARLAGAGIQVDEAAVLAAAAGAPICRPHIALALVRAGHAPTLEVAFARYLGHDSGFYVPRTGLRVVEAIRAIRDAGGLPVLSHPRSLPEADVLALVPEGLRGLETDHPEHSPDMASTWRDVAARAGLLRTGGSDYHGPASVHPDREIGSVRVPDSRLDGLRRAQAHILSIP